MTPTASRRPRRCRTRAISTRRSSRSSSIRSIRRCIAQARADGISENWLEAAQALAGVEDGDGLEDRLPAASGIPHAADGLVRAAALADPGRGGQRARSAIDGGIPDVQVAAHPGRVSRQPIDRRTNGAGHARRWNACWRCAPICAPRPWTASSTRRIAEGVGLSGRTIEEMYQLMAIANYEDRFVIPTAHRETGEDTFLDCAAPAASPSATAVPAGPASACSMPKSRRPRWRCRDGPHLPALSPR